MALSARRRDNPSRETAFGKLGAEIALLSRLTSVARVISDSGEPLLSERGRSERVEIFSNERNPRRCVRLLHWSDGRLRARPDQRILWEWKTTLREGMTFFWCQTARSTRLF